MHCALVVWWALTLLSTGCVQCKRLGPEKQYVFDVITSPGHTTALHECPSVETPRELHVAIIGAGASGTSAAYLLSQAEEQWTNQGIFGCDNFTREYRMQTTVYERTQRVGGRVESIRPLDNEKYAPVELGASIFASMNYNMIQALNTFNLSRTVPEPGIGNYLGIWNGKEFLVDDYDGSKWSLVNMYWRYGYSITRALALIEKAVVAFSRIYSPKFLHNRAPKNTHASRSGYPWVSVSELVSSIKSESLAKQTLHDYLIHEHVSEQFAEEIGAAATRGNYAQDADQIHAFAGLVSMAASETASIQGGNSKLFEHMLEQSGAVVRSGRQGDVTGIMKVSTHQSAPRWWVGTRDGYGQEFDAVIIAAPWLESGITLLNTEAVVPTFEYQNMHVTVVVTDAAQPDPVYFGYPDSYKDVPHTIITTPTEHPTFLSLAYVQTLENVVYGQAWEKLHVVKLFSHARMQRDELQRIFGHGKIVWTHEKEWAAFPKLTPTNTLGFFVVDESMYNINAMERLVSTMETSIVAAKNVAALLLQRWLGTRMVLGYDCKWDEGTAPVATKWAGWGCLSS